MKIKEVLNNLEGDFLDFIRLCNHYEVKYLVIGGYAVGIHGILEQQRIWMFV